MDRWWGAGGYWGNGEIISGYFWDVDRATALVMNGIARVCRFSFI